MVDRTDVCLCVVGDAGVGKSALLITFNTGSFPSGAVTVFSSDIEVGGEAARICFWDTRGHADYDRVRPLSYLAANIFFMCFSVDNRRSFENIPERWLPDLRRHCPAIPIIIVGCKGELRKSRPDDCIPLEEIRNSAAKWQFPYYETSALEQVGLTAPFEECVRLHLQRKRTPLGAVRGFFHKLKSPKKDK